MTRTRFSSGVTPLLDTLFLLLFALLVVSDTRTATRTEPVRIQLPAVEPGSSPASAPAQRFTITIDDQSRLFVAQTDQTIDSREQLDELLAEALGERLPEELVVEIRADASSRSGVALEILQHLLLRGFVRVELAARGHDAEPGAAFGSGSARPQER